VAIGSHQGQVQVIDIARGEITFTLEPGVDQASRDRFFNWNRSGEAASVVRVSPDGQLLVLSFVDNKLLFVDLPSESSTTVVGHEHIVTAAALDSDARLVATGDLDRRVIVWDVGKREKIAEVFIDSPVSALDWRDGFLAIGDERGRIYIAQVEELARPIR
jgi:WD40 repeat protein